MQCCFISMKILKTTPIYCQYQSFFVEQNRLRAFCMNRSPFLFNFQFLALMETPFKKKTEKLLHILALKKMGKI